MSDSSQTKFINYYCFRVLVEETEITTPTGEEYICPL